MERMKELDALLDALGKHQDLHATQDCLQLRAITVEMESLTKINNAMMEIKPTTMDVQINVQLSLIGHAMDNLVSVQLHVEMD